MCTLCEAYYYHYVHLSPCGHITPITPQMGSLTIIQSGKDSPDIRQTPAGCSGQSDTADKPTNGAVKATGQRKLGLSNKLIETYFFGDLGFCMLTSNLRGF